MNTKTFFILCFCLSSLLLNAAENLLKNADFSKLSIGKLPLYWSIRGSADNVAVKKTSITLGGKQNKVLYLIQYKLPLKTGKNYMITWQAKSGQAAKYRVYCEWSTLENGKKRLRSSSGSWFPATKEWKQRKIRFAFPANGGKPYLVLNVKGTDKVSLRHLSICEYKLPLIINPDFAERNPENIPIGWYIRGKRNTISFNDGVVTIKTTDTENVCLIQNGKPQLKSKVKYLVSCEVSGSGSNQYRLYMEWSKMKNDKRRWGSVNTRFNIANEKWQKLSLKFALPEDYHHATLVLNVKGNGIVSVRNLRIKKIGEVSRNANRKGIEKVAFGNKWAFSGDSKIYLTNGIQLHAIASGIPTAVRQGFKFQPGKKYVINYAVKGEGKSGDTTGFYFFQLKMKFPTSGKNITSPVEDTWNKSFQQKRFVFNAPDTNGFLEFFSRSKAKLLFTNFSICQVPDSSKRNYKIILESPAYRNNIYASMPIRIISGFLKTDTPVKNCRIKFFDAQEKLLAEPVIVQKKKSYYFSFHAEKLPDGKYKLLAEFTTLNGKKRNTTIEINKYSPATMEVVQNSARNFLINGKPFYPVNLWYIPFNNAMLFHAAKNGINTTMANDTDILIKLDRAHKFGIKLIVRTKLPKTVAKGDYRIWLHQLETIFTLKVRKHPAFLAYFLVDEPYWKGLSANMLQRCYTDLKKFDPFHPVWINAAPRGTIEEQKDYAAACDIYGVDIYPVPYPNKHSHLDDKTPSCVGKYTHRQSEIAGKRKAIWMALQGFAWGALPGKSGSKIYPSARENRFMVYDAIINGANSAGWWGAQYIQNSTFYKTLFSLSIELHKLSGILTGKADYALSCDNPVIEYCRFQAANSVIMIAANTSNNPVKAVFKKALPDGKIKVIGESRQINVSKGRLQDSFQPYGVHIYQSGKLPKPVYQLPAPHPELTSNPFAVAIHRRKNAVAYKGSANWIWDASLATIPASKVVLARKVVLTRSVKSAYLRVAADDKATIYLNQQYLGTCTAGWSIMECFDVGKKIRSGSNIIQISAIDSGALPCGVLVDLLIEYKDGSKEHIISDTSWLTIPLRSRKLPAFTGKKLWRKAKIITPYGGGAWGNKVRVDKINE